jgi:hypothetical protein
MQSGPLFKSVVKRAVIKVGGNTKEERMPLIQVSEFYQKLADLRVLKSALKEHKNLTLFLCIDQQKFP